MEMSQKTKEDIERLQLLEQQLSAFLNQKQVFQNQLVELENALLEIEANSGNVYKIVGSIMVLTNKEKLREELKGKKEISELRIKNLEKQEKRIEEEAKGLQESVLKEIKNKEE